MGRKARARARERFGWDGVIERTLAVYRLVTGAEG